MVVSGQLYDTATFLPSPRYPLYSRLGCSGPVWAFKPIAIPTGQDRLCGLVVRVLGYISGGPGSIPGTTRKKSSGSGTGFTQPREYN
jgi:hypothetical protein